MVMISMESTKGLIFVMVERQVTGLQALKGLKKGLVFLRSLSVMEVNVWLIHGLERKTGISIIRGHPKYVVNHLRRYMKSGKKV